MDKKLLLSRSAYALVFFSFLAISATMIFASYNFFTRFKHQEVGFAYEHSAEYNLKQLDCLTKNIYYEAASESFEGKVAVGQVTLNRVKDYRFPKSVCEVVYQKNIFYEKIVCQFSWYCTSPSKLHNINKAQYEESEKVAKLVLYENFRLPGLDQAVYYHADYVNPSWNKTKVKKIGKHIFYK